MGTTKSYEIITKNLLELQELIEAKDKKAFLEKFKEVRLSNHNNSCGDAYLQQAVQKIYVQAIEAFILE